MKKEAVLYGVWGIVYEFLGLYTIKIHFSLPGRNRYFLSDIGRLALRTTIFIAVHPVDQWTFDSFILHVILMKTD